MSLRGKVLQGTRSLRKRVRTGFVRLLIAIRWKLVWGRVSSAGWTHWLGVLAALLLGLLASHRLQREPSWQQVRYFGHRLTERLPSDPLTASRTIVVMIDDEEYQSQLNGTSPIDRGYLAGLVDEIRGKEPYDHLPQVIALDVALTKPTMGDPFRDKTLKLYQAIARVPRTTKVVLTYRVTGGPERYMREAGLLDGIRNVFFGCVTLTRDKTRLGLTVPLDDGTEHDTFATAIARAVDPAAVSARENKAREGALVTSFLARQAIPVVRAADIRERKPDVLASLAHKVVIVGGNWKESATGKITDIHDTPFGGDWSGAILNASYVESLLAPNATKKPMSGRFDMVMEVLATIAVSVLFVVVLPGVLRFITLLLVALGVITASVIIFQNFGGFFDCSVVLVFLGIHALLERSGTPHAHGRRWLAFTTAAVTCVVASVFVYVQAKEQTSVFDTGDVAQVAKLRITGQAKDLEIEPPLPLPPSSSPLQDVLPQVQEARNAPAPSKTPPGVAAPRKGEVVMRVSHEEVRPVQANEQNFIATTSAEPLQLATSQSELQKALQERLTDVNLSNFSLMHVAAHGTATNTAFIDADTSITGENRFWGSGPCAPEKPDYLAISAFNRWMALKRLDDTPPEFSPSDFYVSAGADLTSLKCCMERKTFVGVRDRSALCGRPDVIMGAK